MQRVASDLPADPMPIIALSRNAFYTIKLSYSAEMRSARRRPRSVPGGPLSPPTGTPQRRRRLRGKSSAWIALHRYRYCRRRRPGHDAGVAGVGMKRPPGGFSRWPNRRAKPIRGAQGWLSPLPTATRQQSGSEPAGHIFQATTYRPRLTRILSAINSSWRRPSTDASLCSKASS